MPERILASSVVGKKVGEWFRKTFPGMSLMESHVSRFYDNSALWRLQQIFASEQIVQFTTSDADEETCHRRALSAAVQRLADDMLKTVISLKIARASSNAEGLRHAQEALDRNMKPFLEAPKSEG